VVDDGWAYRLGNRLGNLMQVGGVAVCLQHDEADAGIAVVASVSTFRGHHASGRS
jgi:hypothetical protein